MKAKNLQGKVAANDTSSDKYKSKHNEPCGRLVGLDVLLDQELSIENMRWMSFEVGTELQLVVNVLRTSLVVIVHPDDGTCAIELRADATVARQNPLHFINAEAFDMHLGTEINFGHKRGLLSF